MYGTIERHTVGDELHSSHYVAIVTDGEVVLIGIFLFKVYVHEVFRIMETRAPKVARLLLDFFG